MKNLIFILFLLASISIKAQSVCVSADCKDTVRYPKDTVTLNSVVTSPDGIKSVLWITKSSPSAVTISSPASQVTVARKMSASGLYVFQITGTSVKNAVGVAFDTVVYVGNKPPQAIAGPNVTTTTNTAVLSGSKSTDPEGLQLTYAWTQLSGPANATINTNTTSNPLLSGLINGVYNFRLTVTDRGGLTSIATQSVIVAIPVTLIKTVTTTVKTYSDGHTTTTVITVP